MIIPSIIIFCEIARAPQAIFFTVSMLRLSPELRKTSEKRTKIPIFSPAYRPEIVPTLVGFRRDSPTVEIQYVRH